MKKMSWLLLAFSARLDCTFLIDALGRSGEVIGIHPILWGEDNTQKNTSFDKDTKHCQELLQHPSVAKKVSTHMVRTQKKPLEVREREFSIVMFTTHKSMNRRTILENTNWGFDTNTAENPHPGHWWPIELVTFRVLNWCHALNHENRRRHPAAAEEAHAEWTAPRTQRTLPKRRRGWCRNIFTTPPSIQGLMVESVRNRPAGTMCCFTGTMMPGQMPHGNDALPIPRAVRELVPHQKAVHAIPAILFLMSIERRKGNYVLFMAWDGFPRAMEDPVGSASRGIKSPCPWQSSSTWKNPGPARTQLIILTSTLAKLAHEAPKYSVRIYVSKKWTSLRTKGTSGIDRTPSWFVWHVAHHDRASNSVMLQACSRFGTNMKSSPRARPFARSLFTTRNQKNTCKPEPQQRNGSNHPSSQDLKYLVR